MVGWTAFKPKYQVELDFRSELGFWNAEWGDFRISHTVINWLSDTVGNEWLFDERLKDDYSDDLVLTFYFNDENAAMLFKLTWA